MHFSSYPLIPVSLSLLLHQECEWSDILRLLCTYMGSSRLWPDITFRTYFSSLACSFINSPDLWRKTKCFSEESSVAELLTWLWMSLWQCLQHSQCMRTINLRLSVKAVHHNVDVMLPLCLIKECNAVQACTFMCKLPSGIIPASLLTAIANIF